MALACPGSPSRSSRQRSEKQAREGVSTDSLTSSSVASPPHDREMKRRKRRHGEDLDRIGKAAAKIRAERALIGRCRGDEKRLRTVRHVSRAELALQRPEQPELPLDIRLVVELRGERRTALPAEDPVRSVGDVLIEDVRDLARELHEAPIPVRPAEMAKERRVRPALASHIDLLRDRPGHPVEVPDAGDRVAPGARDRREDALEKGPRKRELDVRAHAVPVGDALGDPAFHARPLNDHDRTRQRIASRGRQPRGEPVE